jgi:multidrug efflux system outer membrane protein
VRAQYQIQRSEQLPSVILGATGLAEPNGSGSGSGSGRFYTAGLNITGYELDLFGRVRSLTDGALQQYFASEEARKAAQISLVAAVANSYLTLLADELQLEVTRKTLDTREQSYALVKLKLDNGASSDYEAAQALSLVEGARAALALSPRQRALDRNARERLVRHRLAAGLTAAGRTGPAGRIAGRAAGCAAGAPARRAPGRAPAAGG